MQGWLESRNPLGYARRQREDNGPRHNELYYSAQSEDEIQVQSHSIYRVVWEPQPIRRVGHQLSQSGSYGDVVKHGETSGTFLAGNLGISEMAGIQKGNAQFMGK